MSIKGPIGIPVPKGLKSSCPTDDVLRDYVENPRDPDLEHVGEHIAGCGECYQKYCGFVSNKDQ